MSKINKLMENDTETIIMGDFNFDFRSINKNENSKTQTDFFLIKCIIPSKVNSLQKI